jgi:hypothetical protein
MNNREAEEMRNARMARGEEQAILVQPNCRLDQASARKTALSSASLRFAYVCRFT